jgi:hypothetical protein
MSEGPDKTPPLTHAMLLFQIARSCVFVGLIIIVALSQPPGVWRTVAITIPLVALVLYFMRLRFAAR